MLKKEIVLISLCMFFLMAGRVKAGNNGVFTDLIKDMHQQIIKWENQLEEMEKDPTLPLVKREVIRTIRSLLEQIDKLLQQWLPATPKVKRTQTFRQISPRYVLHALRLVPSLTG
ncbi:MAG: hypothetical protein LWW94_08340 [Candidatus Desulfofervidaceae bacterium]|nr:hypothetical protein [Candidatus Desulfofervidaceae bacterium]